MSFLRPVRVASRLRWLGARSISTPRILVPVLSTLNPVLIQPSDCLDLSGWNHRSLQFLGTPNDTRTRFYYHGGPGPGGLRFPADSVGFLYFHRYPDAAPLECSVRFRLCENHLASSFRAGRDLLLPSGLPWQLILPQLLRPGMRTLANHLLREGLITATQILRCREVFGPRRIPLRSSTLFRIGQEFPVDFRTDPSVLAVAESLWGARLTPFRFKLNSTGKYIWPYTGSALARFEPLVADGRRLVHLRITKIVDPVMCPDPQHLGRIVEPKEGELLAVSLRGAAPTLWQRHVDEDGNLEAALRALWPSTLS
ncbi:hypothetical protein C8R46DRAFT_34914 [Mycena filopes]|nr:hypothetical protein C8R46DRAFT_34914 [Mycena filopes]